MVSIIAAVAVPSRAIGRKGELLFHISDDLRRFKSLTTGHTVVMGRKTFESLPKGALPNRRNIVVTRNRSFSVPGVEVAPSIEEALAMAADDDIFVIGGGEVYAQAFKFADVLDLTVIEAEAPDADTFFPVWDDGRWELAEDSGTRFDEKNKVMFRFVSYRHIESDTASVESPVTPV